MMNIVLSTRDFAAIYLDSILLHTKTLEEALEHPRAVLGLFFNAGLTLNLEKCIFFWKRSIFRVSKLAQVLLSWYWKVLQLFGIFQSHNLIITLINLSALLDFSVILLRVTQRLHDHSVIYWKKILRGNGLRKRCKPLLTSQRSPQLASSFAVIQSRSWD